MMKVTCGFTIPITLYGLPPSVNNILKVMGEITDAGFNTMEMEIVAGEYDDYKANWDTITNHAQSLKLDVVSIMAVTYEMFSLDKAKRDKSLEDFATICEMTAGIGAKMITNCFYLPPEMVPKERTSIYHGGPSVAVDVPEGFRWSDLRGIVIEQLQKSSAIASQNGLQFAMEMRAGDFISSVDGIISIFNDCNVKNIGMVYDVAHANAINEYLDLGIYKLGKYLKLVHLSDNDGTRPYHYQPGKGNIDFKNIIDTLKKVNFDGHVVVDISGIDNILEEAVKMKNLVEELIAE
ncbi:sugar phosphate isomerase/epimerase [Mariniphaga sediminis]|uniref:Sugar phosphate isomerase/epimerase n=1 Tax=Mariniphaga sediminis TaxID=1628158 RepID=A0A399D9L0_9BACT|nr:sugar phosphate isomerase/epimerase [Mariniphaga sediminis]RIH67011.1 sugar phosphate isomerase/epimerase [Mariniphaga sediminis]